jgi:hypothetical protein
MFTLTQEQQNTLSEWLKEQDTKAIENQKLNMKNPNIVIQQSWDDGYPYTGAIGGSVTYMFTPTSIGLVTKVKYGLTDEIIDLTDYDSW